MGGPEEADFTYRFPDEYNYHMEVTTTSGQRFSAAAPYPKGHWSQPLSDAAVEYTFCSLAGDVWSEPRSQNAGMPLVAGAVTPSAGTG
jgi:hypothetical protein